MGRAQEGLNKIEAAKAAYEKFLDINKDSDGADHLVKDTLSRLDNL